MSSQETEKIEAEVFILDSNKDDKTTNEILRLLGEEGIKIFIPLKAAEQINTVREKGFEVDCYSSKVGKFPLRSYDPSVRERSVAEIVITD